MIEFLGLQASLLKEKRLVGTESQVRVFSKKDHDNADTNPIF